VNDLHPCKPIQRTELNRSTESVLDTDGRDHTAAGLFYEYRAMLVAAGLLDADNPSGNFLDAWVAGHDTLHRGSAMLDALGRVGTEVTTTDTSILWRLVDGRGGRWTEFTTLAVDALTAMREVEERRIAAGDLRAVGLLASVRPAEQPRMRLNPDRFLH